MGQVVHTRRYLKSYAKFHLRLEYVIKKTIIETIILAVTLLYYYSFNLILKTNRLNLDIFDFHLNTERKVYNGVWSTTPFLPN